MSDYAYHGCVTSFSEADQVTVWQPTDHPFPVQHTDNSYAERLVARALLSKLGDAHLVMFGYDYSDQMKYATDANGQYSEALRQSDYDNYVATIHYPQLKLTINGEVCPYLWDDAINFNTWLVQKTYNATAVAQYQGDLSAIKERQDIAATEQRYPNFNPMISFNNLSGKDLHVELEFRENHYYRVYADEMAALHKISDTKYQITLKPYNPLPVIEPPSTTSSYVVFPFDMSQEIVPQIMSSTPFVIDFGDGQEVNSFLVDDGLYGVNFDESALTKLETSKQLKIRPKSGNVFGTMVIMGQVLSWGGNKFDASLSDPTVKANLLHMFDLSNPDIALVFNGDYSQAGEPTIVNGILNTL